MFYRVGNHQNGGQVVCTHSLQGRGTLAILADFLWFLTASRDNSLSN